VRVTTEHPEQPGVWERLQGPLRHEHVRLANNWRFANGIDADAVRLTWRATGPQVSHQAVIRDVFLDDPLDSQLQSHASAGNGLAHTLRQLYLHVPPYRGPDVPLHWIVQP